jgi:hypothetical protein
MRADARRNGSMTASSMLRVVFIQKPVRASWRSGNVVVERHLRESRLSAPERFTLLDVKLSGLHVGRVRGPVGKDDRSMYTLARKCGRE